MSADVTVLPWFHHIELVGGFFLFVYLLGTFGRILLERWLLSSCTVCAPTKEIADMKAKQTQHREIIHLELEKNIAIMTEKIKKIDDVNKKLDDVLRKLP